MHEACKKCVACLILQVQAANCQLKADLQTKQTGHHQRVLYLTSAPKYNKRSLKSDFIQIKTEEMVYQKKVILMLLLKKK